MVEAIQQEGGAALQQRARKKTSAIKAEVQCAWSGARPHPTDVVDQVQEDNQPVQRERAHEKAHARNQGLSMPGTKI